MKYTLICLLISISTLALNTRAGDLNPESTLKEIFESVDAPVSDKAEDVNMAPVVVGTVKALSKQGYSLGTSTWKWITLEELVKNNFKTEGVFVLLEQNDKEFKGSIRMYLPIDTGMGTREAANVYIFVFGIVDTQSKKIKVEKVEIEFRGIS